MTRRAAAGGSSIGPPSRGARRAQQAFYVGRRPGRIEVYVVTRRDVQRLRLHGRDDVAFAWGPDAGSGARALADAMLAHATGRQAPEPVRARFHAELLASLPSAGFVVGCDDIAQWLAAGRWEPRTWRPLDARSREGSLGRLARLLRFERSRARG